MGLISKLFDTSSEVNSEILLDKYRILLIQEEKIELGFQLFRDVYLFTNKRLLLIDFQGVTGSKTEYFSLPYRFMTRFSVESAGFLDMDAELKIWISSENEPAISKKFNKNIDVYKVQRYLASKIL